MAVASKPIGSRGVFVGWGFGRDPDQADREGERRETDDAERQQHVELWVGIDTHQQSKRAADLPDDNKQHPAADEDARLRGSLHAPPSPTTAASRPTDGLRLATSGSSVAPSGSMIIGTGSTPGPRIPPRLMMLASGSE